MSCVQHEPSEASARMDAELKAKITKVKLYLLTFGLLSHRCLILKPPTHSFQETHARVDTLVMCVVFVRVAGCRRWRRRSSTSTRTTAAPSMPMSWWRCCEPLDRCDHHYSRWHHDWATMTRVVCVMKPCRT